MKSHDASTDRDKKRQGICCQREDQPAERPDAERIEDKPEGEHAGVACAKMQPSRPFITIVAKLWI
jgi:hypothetical protein